jgi:hypothetical protein
MKLLTGVCRIWNGRRGRLQEKAEALDCGSQEIEVAVQAIQDGTIEN